MDKMKPMKPMAPMQPMQGAAKDEPWWPKALGEPSSTGASNDKRYAFFADDRRLAVDDGEHVRVYDTGQHRIHGFSQSSGKALSFSSDSGSVGLDALSEVR